MRIVISAPDKVCTSCNTVRSVAFARDNRRISVANSVGDPLFEFQSMPLEREDIAFMLVQYEDKQDEEDEGRRQENRKSKKK